MKLLLVDDHPLFRTGLAAALNNLCESRHNAARPRTRIAAASTMEQGLALATRFAPDIVLLDYHLQESSGLQVLREFACRFPLIARVVISGDDSPHTRTLVRAEGASGFISKTLAIEAVWSAITAVAEGGEWWHAPEPGFHLSDAARLRTDQTLASPAPATLRQLEVLHLIAQGLGNRAIAQALFITERTVKQHVSDLFAKSGANNRIQLLHAAKHRGWL